VEAPWMDVKLGLFNQDTARDVALTSLLAGGASGAVVCGGSAPFELVKVRPMLLSWGLAIRVTMTDDAGTAAARVPNLQRLTPHSL
jgi:hypothetical protein